MIHYLGLEPYRERYTELLTGWVQKRAKRRGLALHAEEGIALGRGIRTGRVLDAFGRCHWATTQTALLVQRWERGEVSADDTVWVDDMFHPGIESLAYIADLTGVKPRVIVRNWAQSVDVYDFTHSMIRWMRPYEQMVAAFADLILVASSVHLEEMACAGFDVSKVRVVGLPFDSADVRERAGILTRKEEPERKGVVFSSRLDPEKNPIFMLMLAKRLAERGHVVRILTGADTIRSADPTIPDLVAAMVAEGSLEVRTGLSKPDYYGEVLSARLHLNTSRQDYVSFALLEASALGTPSLAPAFKSFPEVFPFSARQLYIPFDLEDALARALALIESPPGWGDVGYPARFHDGTLDRIFDLIGRRD